MAWKDYLPDLKGSLASFYDEKIKPTIENKSSEFKELVKENFARGANTQKALIALVFGILLLLALAFFWKDGTVQWKYLALGSLLSYLGCYVVDLKPEEFSQKLFK